VIPNAHDAQARNGRQRRQARQSDRSGYIVFDLKDPSDLPSICEPFFTELGAKIELVPVMTTDDVRKGVEKAYPGTASRN